jgi:cytochrome c553
MSKTAWALASLVVLMVALGLTVQATEHAYVGADKCKMCHRVQFASWETTTHARATDAAKGSTDPAFSAECLTCHATNGDETMAGVQCEMCHGPGADYKKLSIMKDRDQAVANGLIIPTQATCARCHTGDGHSKAVVLADQVKNKQAIHEFKAPQ